MSTAVVLYGEQVCTVCLFDKRVSLDISRTYSGDGEAALRMVSRVLI